jgi:hypothetical protein
MLKKGDKGEHVKRLQEQLLLLGERLPRWGADGACGDETIAAVNHALLNYKGNGVVADSIISSEEIAAIEALLARRENVNLDLPVNYVPTVGEHPLPKAQLAKQRPWSQVSSIVLHQTACELGEEPRRWFGVPVHVGVTRKGQVLYLNEFTWNLPHANGFNSRSVGIEIDGTFEGIEGDISTWWPSPGYKAPMKPTQEQIVSAREAVRWICSMTAKNGGKITHILAHRQSSADRVSDPGSRIWHEVGLWAQRELGLSDGGDSFTVGEGRPIPKQWDASKQAKYL